MDQGKRRKRRRVAATKKQSRDIAGEENNDNKDDEDNSDARRMLQHIDERLRGVYNRDSVLKAMQEKRRRDGRSVTQNNTPSATSFH